MDESNEAIEGEEIVLASGAKVALFRDVAPGVHALHFTNGEHTTRLKLSDGALCALVALATRGGGMVWTVA